MKIFFLQFYIEKQDRNSKELMLWTRRPSKGRPRFCSGCKTFFSYATNFQIPSASVQKCHYKTTKVFNDVDRWYHIFVTSLLITFTKKIGTWYAHWYSGLKAQCLVSIRSPLPTNAQWIDLIQIVQKFSIYDCFVASIGDQKPKKYDFRDLKKIVLWKFVLMGTT